MGSGRGVSRGGRGATPIQMLQWTAFVSTLDRFVMPPMLVAIARDLDVPLASVVQAAGAYFLAYGLSQPIWGAVTERFGRVRTMRVALLVAGMLALISGLAWSPLSLGIMRGLAGCFFGVAYPSSLIYIGDTVPAARRQRDVARLMVGVAMGTAIASVGAGVLVDVASWRVAFLVTGAASLALAWALRMLPEPGTARTSGWSGRSFRAVTRSRTAMLLVFLAFVEGAVLLGGLTLLPPALEHAGAGSTTAGAVTAIYGFSVFAGAVLVGRLANTWHPSRLILLGAGAAVLAWALLALSQHALVAVLVVLLIGLAWTAMHSSLQTWATEVLPAARATVVSFFAGALFAGSAAAAAGAGALVDAGRYEWIYAALALIALPLGLGASIARRRWLRPDADERP